MTATASHTPLLLHRRQVIEMLPGFTPDVVHDYRQDGELRIFLPNPATHWAYYFAADVARIGKQFWDVHWIETLPAELTAAEFELHSGLAPRAFWTAIRCGTLGQRRSAHGVRVPSSELKRFL